MDSYITSIAFTHALVGTLCAFLVFQLLGPPKENAGVVTEINNNYDYIIVGAGSAGCVVASRLSQDPNVTVLLVEAGGDDRGDVTIMTPGLNSHLVHTKYDWEYYTVPQKHALKGFKDQKSFWPRGKVLGGSSNLNSMVSIRGHKMDYDRWAEQGAHGWSYKDVLPFFIKMEDNMVPELASDSEYHGQGGPMKVTMPHTMPLTDYLIQGGLDLGLNVTDHNGPDMRGVSVTQSNSYRGIRWSSSRAYLHGVMDQRPNLHVKLKTHVTKLVFDGKTATGIEMICNNQKLRAKVNKEVILSAGTIGSPQILMLSGVGPKQLLDSLAIPVIADLPVGQNLQDHLFFEYSIGLNTSVSATPEWQDSLWSRLQHKLFGTGILSSSHYVEVQVFDCTGEISKRLSWPDLQIMFHQTPWRLEALRNFGFTEETLQESASREKHTDMFACEASLLRPESIGSIKLKSSDPFDYPDIDPNYLEMQADVDLLIRGIRYCQRYMRTPSMQKVGAVPADGPNKFCSEHKYDSDEYWACMVRQRIHTIYHPVGTCKMGASGDKTAVVDHTLRVKKVKGIRVVDGSVMPSVVSGNTNTPIIMIGEKAAHMIMTGV